MAAPSFDPRLRCTDSALGCELGRQFRGAPYKCEELALRSTAEGLAYLLERTGRREPERDRE